jgi:hypothetical protein
MGIVAVGAMEGAQATRINDNVPIKIIKINLIFILRISNCGGV